MPESPERTTPTVFPGAAAPYGGGDPYADYRAPDPAALPFARLPDLADRRVGGSVTAASDEFFAERENLLVPGPARFDPDAFGHKGKIMDGWETRRRRGRSAARPHPEPEAHDWALIRLGVPGLLHGLVVDTAHFRGNHPRAVRVEGAELPADAELPVDADADAATTRTPAAEWTELVPVTEVGGHAAHAFPLPAATRRRLTHLRLSQYPDGGIARLRAHGEPRPDPGWLAALGTFDLVALENGGLVEDASDRFYSPPVHTVLPGRSRSMEEGWETRRRRDTGHDWLRYRLAARGVLAAVAIDTGNYRGNAPGWAELAVWDGRPGEPAPSDPARWRRVLPRTRLLPDTVHRFVLPNDTPPATHARLDVFPDGGVARLRLYGTPTEDGWRQLRARRGAHDH